MLGYILIPMAILDVVLTYFYIKDAKKLYPDRDYTKFEANLILRLLWKQVGFKWGTLLGALFVVLPIITVLSYYADKYPSIFFFLLGAYTLVFNSHIGCRIDLEAQKKCAELRASTGTTVTK